MRVICDFCLGLGTTRGIGLIRKECVQCLGVKYIELENKKKEIDKELKKETEVIQKNHDESFTVKKGRKRAAEDVLKEMGKTNGQAA